MAETSQTAGGSSALPSLEETRRWIGSRLDEMGGASVARVEDVYVDQESGEPVWIVIKVGRFGKLTALPLRDCAAVAGHVWAAYPRETIRGAPTIDAQTPLTREQELELCAHFGIAEDQARAGEIAGRPEGAVTSQAPAIAVQGPAG
jgi:PRC-barrel domain